MNRIPTSSHIHSNLDRLRRHRRAKTNARQTALEKTSAAEIPGAIRVGRWLFVPDEPPEEHAPALRNAPLFSNSAAPTPIVDELLCSRGELVWHHPLFAPIGITAAAFGELSLATRVDPQWTRRTRVVREAPRYARGSVRHPSRPPVFLSDWHRVYAAR